MRPREVDARGGRRRDRPVGDFLDHAVLDQDGDAVLQFVAARIEEASAAEQIACHVSPHCCITPPKWRQCRLLDEPPRSSPLRMAGWSRDDRATAWSCYEMPLLEIRGLTRSYYGVHALRGVDWRWMPAASPG